MPEEVLRVDRLFRGAREQDARGEGILRVGQRLDAGLARICSHTGRDRAAESRVGGIGQRGGLGPALRRGKACAAGDNTASVTTVQP